MTPGSYYDFELDPDFDEIERQQRRIEEIERVLEAVNDGVRKLNEATCKRFEPLVSSEASGG